MTFGPTASVDRPEQRQPDAHSNPCTPKLPDKVNSAPFVQGQRIRLKKGEVNYQLLGPPTAPVVLCLHGLNGALSSFEGLMPLLVQSFRVLCFDLYGFGLSAAPSGRLDIDAYVGQVQELLDALMPNEKVFLLGFSMGGCVAVEFTNRFPERVERLLLVAPGGLLQRSKTPCQPLLFGCLRTRLGGCLLSAATLLACCSSCCVRRNLRGDKLADRFELDVREPEKFKGVSRQNGERFLWNLHRSVNSYLRVLRRMPLWADDFKECYVTLAKGSTPLLFLWGDSDCTVPFCEAEEEVRQIFAPNGVSCCMLPEAGHGLLLEDAAQVAHCATAWFSDLQDPAWQQCLARWRLRSPDAPADPGAV
ncbi:unnamed protein product [Effrenium voratum]|uniref:AB hydrolase-1 domain-containing protein n=1 Tax=Effrenium voratum TaxID=2562239 RepID=A0AA36NCV3_9DINO|nr:unnamed protein product [Effrenium voratum]CAJ1435023.1 unnamed protein product [Effrenium voratum]